MRYLVQRDGRVGPAIVAERAVRAEAQELVDILNAHAVGYTFSLVEVDV